jgi:hypothetical protein
MIAEAREQRLEQGGPGGENLVVDGVGAGVATDAAAHGLGQAEHADDVAAVGVQGELAAAPIGALAPILAPHVGDVPEPIAHRALRHGASEMGTQAPEDLGQIVR